MATKIITPPCRIVWGHPLESQIKTDPKTKKPILNKEGGERNVWACGLAIPVANWPAVEQALAAEAFRMYPGGNFPRDFSWKIKRENELDENGKPYGEREGYAGHVVLACSTEAFCPAAYKFENGKYRQLNANEFKCGDWVVAELTFDGHAGGVYVNPGMFEVVGYDKEIQRRGGSDPSEAFGGRQHQLPPGVSTTPTAPVHNVTAPQQQQPAAAPGYPPPGAPVGQPYQQPAPAHYAAPQAPAAPVGYAPQQQQPAAAPGYPPPAHDFVQNAGIPQAPGNVASHAAMPPPSAHTAPATAGGVPGATSYPSNMPPPPPGAFPQR